MFFNTFSSLAAILVLNFVVHTVTTALFIYLLKTSVLSDISQYFRPRVHQNNDTYIVKKLSSAFSSFFRTTNFQSAPSGELTRERESSCKQQTSKQLKHLLGRGIPHLKLCHCQVMWNKKNLFWFLNLGLYFPFKASLIKILIEANLLSPWPI